MGYYITQQDSSFVIKKENIDKALKAIQDLHKVVDEKGGGSSSRHGKITKHYSWVREDFYKIDNLKEMLEEWGWDVVFDEDRGVLGIDYGNQKMGDEVIMLRATAPFVEEGSYIVMRGEDNTNWVWAFEKGVCKELDANAYDWCVGALLKVKNATPYADEEQIKELNKICVRCQHRVVRRLEGVDVCTYTGDLGFKELEITNEASR